MNKAMIIFGKDWQEIRQSLGIMATLILIPLLFTIFAIGVVLLFAIIGPSANMGKSSFDLIMRLHPEWRGYDSSQLMQGFGAVEGQLFFMIIPTTVTVTIASYSIVGEKEKRTLEPLLATPIETWQLLLGKALVSVIPGALATWAAYAIYAVVLKLVAAPLAANYVTSAPYLILIFIFTPLLTTLIVLFSLIVSSRVSDARTAQQFSAVIIVPLVLLFVGQTVGILNINTLVSLLICLVTLLLDLVALLLAVALFQREAILTRWK
jgi:ABC-2 type transport system permease protein